MHDSVLPALFCVASVLPSVLPALPVSFRLRASPALCRPCTVSCVPARVDVKPKFWFSPRGSVCLMIFTEPQFCSWKGTGPTRSFICACAELPELRLTAYELPKLSH